MMRPLCFILMPFGQKQAGELLIDFDQIYATMIKPAILDAGMEPIRADEEKTDGIIHKAMFERLILCEYAVADLTSANANVFYELGVRHAVKPYTTVLIFANTTRLPFDVNFLRALPYSIDSEGKLTEPGKAAEALTAKLKAAKENATTDSPLFQLLESYPEVSHEKTDIFRQVVEYSKQLKETLAGIRNSPQSKEEKKAALQAFETGLGALHEVESGVLIDLFLSYRAIDAHDAMVTLAGRMPKPLAASVLVREQLGFALNRLKKRKEAETVLLELIRERGPSSETHGILGRVYKDQWSEAEQTNNSLAAKGFLRKAIDSYKRGFEADWRDAYPGVNACTLMFIENPEQDELKKLLPIVRYAVVKKIENREGDYWDYATLFELDMLERNTAAAQQDLESAAALLKEEWHVNSTLTNLRLLRTMREKSGDAVQWLLDFEQQLETLKNTQFPPKAP
ncbi:MAG: DUF4071 domain-containing protein [Saprospirales bacterium]|nr:DUF4071 domain-containing protein [Saprospirales bacterium]